ncbi:hypothetical protein FGO68_gene10909 [Halteria grandinella]|uniref:Leucine Rich Repeat family protein n=1 Tax=Halteria grandinella TaxID=5974 RepID=A0A8J8T7Z8_HALGN|nr:hypothetical protein FGO68_gene10909 [Halteria grandinella]
MKKRFLKVVSDAVNQAQTTLDISQTSGDKNSNSLQYMTIEYQDNVNPGPTELASSGVQKPIYSRNKHSNNHPYGVTFRAKTRQSGAEMAPESMYSRMGKLNLIEDQVNKSTFFNKSKSRTNSIGGGGVYENSLSKDERLDQRQKKVNLLAGRYSANQSSGFQRRSILQNSNKIQAFFESVRKPKSNEKYSGVVQTRTVVKPIKDQTFTIRLQSSLNRARPRVACIADGEQQVEIEQNRRLRANTNIVIEPYQTAKINSNQQSMESLGNLSTIQKHNMSPLNNPYLSQEGSKVKLFTGNKSRCVSQLNTISAVNYNQQKNTLLLSTDSNRLGGSQSPTRSNHSAFLSNYEKNGDYDGMHTLEESMIVDLFQARSRDIQELHLSTVKKVLETFKLSIMKQSRHGKLILRNMQLGVYSATFFHRQLLGRANILSIRVIDLANNNLRDDGVEILCRSLGADNKSLISLNLASNSITHLGMFSLARALEKNESIIELGLASELEGNACNKLGHQGAEILAKLLKKQKILQIVNIRGNSIGDRGFKVLCEMLAENYSLVSLNVEKNQITQLGAAQLSRVIQGNEDKIKLQCLIMSKNLIGRNGLDQLIQDLCHRSTLSILSLSEIGIDSSFSIIQSLRLNQYLERLDLSFNNLSDATETLFQGMAQSNNHLKHLNVNNCQIGDDGIIGLLSGYLIKQRHQLITLQLRSNNLTDKLSSHLGDFLKQSLSLKELDLSLNQLTDITGLSIAKSLEKNRTLVQLNLQGNMFKSASGEALSKATLANHTLQSLKLKFNMIKYYYLSQIGENIKRNQIMKDENGMQLQQKEIESLRSKKAQQKEVFRKLEQAHQTKDKEQEKITEISEQMEQFIQNENDITAQLEEEFDYQRQRLVDVEKALHTLEIQLRKLDKKTKDEVEKREKQVTYQTDMIPMNQRDIKDLREKIKKVKKENREEIQAIQQILYKAWNEERKREEEYKEILMIYKVEVNVQKQQEAALVAKVAAEAVESQKVQPSKPTKKKGK